MSDEFVVKVVVAGEGYNGPDMWFVKVICNQEQLDNGDHYEAAKEWVRNNVSAADCIDWVCDDKDPAKAVLKLFNWDTASTTRVGVAFE
jgi:hypothetical protein